MDFSRLHTYTPPQCVPENTGYTYSLSSSYSSTALDFENKHKLHPVFESPKMSRRSLRLTTGHYSDDSYLDTSNSSMSHSGKYKESRSLKQQISASKQCALPSQHPPRKALSHSLLTQSSFHSCAGDMSLMTTMLEDSSIQERTLMGSFWGLDEEGDLKGADATVIMANGDITTAETQTSVINGYTCNESTMLSDRKDALTVYSPSHTASSTTVYSKDKGKKSSIFRLFREQFLSKSKYAAASIVSLLMQLIQNVLLKIGYEAKAHSSFCGSMNVKDVMTGDGHLGLNGSLCDDCKGKKHLQTQKVRLQSSRFNRAAQTLWHMLSYTGYYVLQAMRTVASAGWLVTRKLLSVLWLAIVSPGKAVSGAVWWLGTGWYQLVTLMSLLNVFVLTRYLPKLYKLLVLLIPFLLLLGLWYFGPASWLSLLPVLSRSEMQASLEDATSSTPVEEPVATGNVQPSTESLHHASQSGAHFFDSGRMVDLERQLALLSDRCDRSSQQYDERHGRVVELFHQLQEQVAQMSNKEGMSVWINNLFNQHVSSLEEELRREGTDQSQNEFLMLHQGHESRITELEKLLQIIAAKTEEQKQEYTKATTVGGQSEEQSSLLSEVKRLELELSHIKADLLRVQSSPPVCARMDCIRETVDTQVKESVKLLIFGNKDEEMSESLLQWLSTQFVRQSDLQGLLMEMEMKILKNITMYKSQTKQMPTAQVVTHAVNNAGAAGMSEEQVRVIVKNALRLYSQDKTGLVDYALESGGGSILSTRCSETYETKTALMSLFGIPLWYFSQSPRVIIQPDVHPGNCWAFKGSQGYLVIRLSFLVYPTSFSLEHIPKSLSPTGSINSAPKDFTVYGLEEEYQEEGKLLGRYTYNEDGDSLQTFPIQEENDKAYQVIEMKVLSNWGHPEYTCLYRFRVHGEPRLE
ncbi:SUN domain-containing protein 1 isoform X1 [Acipenser ruthenus]|uniref:SUN domain-containing protein 1 isoform X1 n=2 Tax=Acipenser ruthenus TaxID=7906 RepID=UPI002740DC7C|nr:SUN domain-containing protein 1 isoform X1 [Acipenser ruthenus]XP_058891612.1 SUN domain-containing protein 1 isoform X1 [Acipenser ruthenus]